MALQSEIDAFIAAGTAQGLSLPDMMIQLQQRFGQTQYPDEFVPISGSFQHTFATGNFYDILAFIADTDTAMPFDQVWGRAWGAAMDGDLNMLCQYLMQMVRVLGRDNLFNTSFPRFSAKSIVTSGTAFFTF